jgi:hypothetical protein
VRAGDISRARPSLLCIGHAGGSALAPASTLRSFEVAARLGVDVVGFDVRVVRAAAARPHDPDAWRPGCLDLEHALALAGDGGRRALGARGGDSSSAPGLPLNLLAVDLSPPGLIAIGQEHMHFDAYPPALRRDQAGLSEGRRSRCPDGTRSAALRHAPTPVETSANSGCAVRNEATCALCLDCKRMPRSSRFGFRRPWAARAGGVPQGREMHGDRADAPGRRLDRARRGDRLLGDGGPWGPSHVVCPGGGTYAAQGAPSGPTSRGARSCDPRGGAGRPAVTVSKRGSAKDRGR